MESRSPKHASGTNLCVYFTLSSYSQKTSHLPGGLIIDPGYALLTHLFMDKEKINFLSGRKPLDQPNKTKASVTTAILILVLQTLKSY